MYLAAILLGKHVTATVWAWCCCCCFCCCFVSFCGFVWLVWSTGTSM